MHNKTLTVTFMLASTLLASACSTGTDTGQLVLSKPTLTSSKYLNDTALCDAYVETKGPSSEEKTGSVVASLLIGGVFGGLAAAGSNEEGEARLFEECMYGKGYQLISLPEGYHDLKLKEDQRYDMRKASLELLEAEKTEELQTWSRASAINTPGSYAEYLEKYPNGFFADQARQGPIQPK